MSYLTTAALGTVYLVWGSTYLGIAVAIQTLPPLLMGSARFLLAGALLYGWSIRRGDRAGDPVGARQWLAAFVVGSALLAAGNGGVIWGEQFVPTGIASLLIATMPLWMVLFSRVMLRERLTWPVLAGLAVGFAGLVLLVRPAGAGRLHLAATAVMLTGAVAWAAGSVWSRRAPLPRRPLVSTGMQMLAGGVTLGVVGIATGELGRAHLDRVSAASALAFAYLIVFGSLLAFSAYAWLLRNARTPLVATYAYVNPVVAVLLGWVVLDEPVTARTVLAGTVIVLGVALIVSARRPAPAPEPAAVPDASRS